MRPHSVSPKCTSLAVAIVASSRPAGCASVRTAAGSQRVGRRALDRERVLGVGLEPGDRARRGTGPSVVTSCVADPRRDLDSPASVVNVTTTSSGPTLDELGVGDAPSASGAACGGRCGRTVATGPAAARRGATAAAPRAPTRAACRRRSSSTDDRRLERRRSRRRSPRPPRASRPARSSGRRRRAAHSGTFPCLRDGSCSRFVRSIASDRTSTLRVSRGSITSST